MLRKTAAGTYVGPWIQAPGDVFADLAAAVAEGADCVDRAAQLWTDREQACSRSRRCSPRRSEGSGKRGKQPPWAVLPAVPPTRLCCRPTMRPTYRIAFSLSLYLL
jgi:hypothetical protein